MQGTGHVESIMAESMKALDKRVHSSSPVNHLREGGKIITQTMEILNRRSVL